MRLKECPEDNPDRLVVMCEDCDLRKVFDADDPPAHLVEYWGSQSRARQDWSPVSAAKGARDNHNMSAFVDYEDGIRHSAYIEVVE